MSHLSNRIARRAANRRQVQIADAAQTGGQMANLPSSDSQYGEPTTVLQPVDFAELHTLPTDATMRLMVDASAQEQRQNSGRDDGGKFCSGNRFAFEPGRSGNPAGRPKGKSITAALNQLLQDGLGVTDKNTGVTSQVDVVKALARKAIQAALAGDFRFWNAIVERTDGKVTEDIHVTTGLTMILHPATPPPGWHETVRELIGHQPGEPPLPGETPVPRT